MQLSEAVATLHCLSESVRHSAESGAGQQFKARCCHPTSCIVAADGRSVGPILPKVRALVGCGRLSGAHVSGVDT